MDCASRRSTVAPTTRSPKPSRCSYRRTPRTRSTASGTACWRAAAGVRVGQELEQHRRDDLPGQAPPVLEPAALDLPAAALQQAVPEAVDLVLGVRRYEQRDGFGERVVGATVERLDAQSVDHETHRHDGAR